MDFLLHRGSAHLTPAFKGQLYVRITLTLLASQGLYSYNITLYYQIFFPSLHQIIFSTAFNILKYFPSLKISCLETPPVFKLQHHLSALFCSRRPPLISPFSLVKISIKISSHADIYQENTPVDSPHQPRGVCRAI